MGGRASRELAEVTERLGQARTECEYRQSGVDGEQQGPARSNCTSLYYSRLRWGYHTLYCVHLHTVHDQPSHDHPRDIVWSR